MSHHAYAFTDNPATMAKAVGRDLGISTKASVAICARLRRRNLAQAKALLERVIEQREAIPFPRAPNGPGHKPGMGPGRFPVKAASQILGILKAAEANARSKGLGDLRVAHICAHRGPKRWHFGRLRRRAMKRTHVEVVLQEIEGTRRAKKDAKGKVPDAPKGAMPGIPESSPATVAEAASPTPQAKAAEPLAAAAGTPAPSKPSAPKSAAPKSPAPKPAKAP